jgi:hypothetical protein
LPLINPTSSATKHFLKNSKQLHSQGSQVNTERELNIIFLSFNMISQVKLRNNT